MTFKRNCLLFVISAVIITTVYARPKYLDCSSTEDCQQDSCCVLGNGRYSTSRCSLNGRKGALCRPLQDNLVNRTLTYPDGVTVDFTNIYMTLCPCAEGHHCSKITGKCEPYLNYELYDNFDDTNNYV